MLLWKPCADAFKTAGIPTPAEVMRDRGVLFIHIDALSPPLNNTLKKLGFSDAEREVLRNDADYRRLKGAGGLTIDPNKGSGLGKPATTILFDSSFSGASGFSFNEIMPHESVHRSGVGENYAWYQYLPFFDSIGHDLTGYDPYESILKNCRQP